MPLLILLLLSAGASASPKGRQFVAAFFEQPYERYSFPNMFFVILSEVNATVHVESGFGISEDLHIQAMEDYKYKVNESFYYQANLQVTNMSFYFSSTADITLFCYHTLAHRGDGYLALPTETLSTEYIVVTHIDNNTSEQAELLYTGTTQTAFLIVATEDNTQVNISLKIQGPLMAGGCGNGTFFNGEIRTFTLNKYQTVGAYCEEDITGTLITSDKPVAVISGHNMKFSDVNKDGMQEMLLPVKSFGRSYYLPVPPPSTGGAIYRVVGSVASTSVRSPSVSNISFTVGERESHDITVDSTTGPVCIEADKPVMVVQIVIKTPSLALVPPTSLYSSSYDIGIPVIHAIFDLKKVYITVIVPTDKVLGIRPQIFPQFKIIKGSCFSEASVELTAPGFYRLTHVDDVPFGAMMYVFPFVDSKAVFTHPAGLNLTSDVDKNKCPPSEVCSDGIPYPCTCSTGYFDYQCIDTSAGCTDDPCQFSSPCTDLKTLYQCDCINGSGGAHCETDILDDCANNNCTNGSCVDQVGGYSCNCSAGYTGSFCETGEREAVDVADIDECASSPCAHGTCVDHVSNYTCACEPGYTDRNCNTGASASPKGRRFVAAFFEQPYHSVIFPNMFFVILSEVNATVHVESGFGISEDLHVQAMEDYKYKVDESFYYRANLQVTDMSFYFSSTADITLFCYHVLANKGDGYLALPTETLSTEYIVVTHIDNNTGVQASLPYTGTTQTAFLIVATEDNTQVNISLQIQGPLMAGGCGNGTFFNGENRTFTLNKYQTVGAYCEEDITGTLITSDKPVAVISGHNMKYTLNIKDGMQEMLLPVKSFGRSYYLPVPPPSAGGAIYRVVGSVASTSIRSPSVSSISFTVGERESHDITVDSTTGPVYIEADKPVMVVQIAIKIPSLALVPPTNLYSSSYDIGKPVLHATYDLKKVYISVIVPTDKVLGIRPQIFPQFKIIKGSCFSEASVELTAPGFYRLTHVDDVPFGAMMYVFPFADNKAVFTHPAGLNLTDDVDKTKCPPTEVCSDGIPYPCTCSTGYFDYQCIDTSAGCAVNPCQFSSPCTDLKTLYQCDCVNGSGGAHCETDILDDCANNSCTNGSCVDQVGSYSCNCSAGFTGTFCETDIDDCAVNPCVNGTCVDHVNNYTCDCDPGYTDRNCSTDIDDCTPIPCVHGACVDHVNNYTCSCNPGYTDRNCSTDIDDCATNPCVNGTCVDHVNNYACDCEPGYTDRNCSTDIDECATNPCVHGTCVDHVNNYTCTCNPGYTDRNCSTDIDDCTSNPCVHGACVDHVNNYTCSCNPGYTDRNCSTDIDECATNPCVNGACVDHVNNYTCDCEAGYTDRNCSTDIDDCASNPCVNNGTCVDMTNGYNCTCPDGIDGKDCEIGGDPCVRNPCQNNGTCIARGSGFNCSCQDGFEGDTCQTDQNCRLCIVSVRDMEFVDDCVITCMQDVNCVSVIYMDTVSTSRRCIRLQDTPTDTFIRPTTINTALPSNIKAFHKKAEKGPNGATQFVRGTVSAWPYKSEDMEFVEDCVITCMQDVNCVSVIYMDTVSTSRRCIRLQDTPTGPHTALDTVTSNPGHCPCS